MEWPTADSMRPLEEYFGIALVLCAIGALVWGFFLGLPGCTRRQEMRISGAVSSALALVAFAGASTALIVWMPELNPYLVFLVALLVALLVAAMRLGVRIQKRRTANP